MHSKQPGLFSASFIAICILSLNLDTEAARSLLWGANPKNLAGSLVLRLFLSFKLHVIELVLVWMCLLICSCDRHHNQVCCKTDDQTVFL